MLLLDLISIVCCLSVWMSVRSAPTNIIFYFIRSIFTERLYFVSFAAAICSSPLTARRLPEKRMFTLMMMMMMTMIALHHNGTTLTIRSDQKRFWRGRAVSGIPVAGNCVCPFGAELMMQQVAGQINAD